MGKRRENSGRRNGPAGASKANGSNPARNGAKQARLALAAEEVDVLLKACRKYRAKMPVYLLSAQPEFHAVDKLIRKLQQAQD